MMRGLRPPMTDREQPLPVQAGLTDDFGAFGPGADPAPRPCRWGRSATSPNRAQVRVDGVALSDDSLSGHGKRQTSDATAGLALKPMALSGRTA
jgi:hypothetical protein